MRTLDQVEEPSSPPVKNGGVDRYKVRVVGLAAKMSHAAQGRSATAKMATKKDGPFFKHFEACRPFV